MGENGHFAAKSASGKIALYRSPRKIFASNFTDRLTAWGISKKMQIRSKGVAKGSSDLLLEFRYPYNTRQRLKLKTANSTCRLIIRLFNETYKIRSKGVGKGSRENSRCHFTAKLYRAPSPVSLCLDSNEDRGTTKHLANLDQMVIWSRKCDVVSFYGL